MPITPTPDTEARWHVLWTRSHCEQLVHDQLVGKHFELFLPKLDSWSRSRIAGTRCIPGAPLFPGYLFLRHGLDKESYLEVRKARGLVAVLGDRWDRLAVLPEPEIEAIRRTVESRLPARAHPYLREGRRVRITRGPLTDIEGILVRLDKMNRGLVVLSVDLLQRSVAVEVDCTAVEPVAGAWRVPDAGARRATAAPVL
jgi:transcription antitermination factor NusG